MTLVVDAEMQRDGFRLAVALEASAGSTVALLGPNGAGKSTVVEAVAGLRAIDAGRIGLDTLMFDAPAEGVFIPARSRGIGVVFQDGLLFPTMTVKDNVRFGATGESADRWMESLDLIRLAERTPAQLSGGERQRVALARALASEPRVLLLDEPFASVDVAARSELRRTLADHLSSFAGPRVLITHDPLDAYALADHVYVIEDGRITQHGTADDLRLRPRSGFAADLGGVNLFGGVAAGGSLDVSGHMVQIADTGAAGRVLATIHPHSISLHRNRPEGSQRNVWQTSIARVEALGDRVRVQVGEPLPLTAEITPAATTALGLSPGSEVWVAIKATEIGIQPD